MSLTSRGTRCEAALLRLVTLASLVLLASCHLRGRTAHAPAFREGGLDAALAAARASRVPVFLDLWATWCPPCMAMRAGTYRDSALYPLADKFVWVSVDRDSDEGEALASRLGVVGIPVLFVLDAGTGAPRARWSYPVSGPELAVLLDAVTATPPVEGLADIVASPLASGHPETVTESNRARVRSLLDRSPPTWPLAPFAANELLSDAESREDFDDCVALATRYANRLPAGSLRAALVVNAEGCALKTTPPRPDVHRALLEQSEKLVEDPATPILPFDRAWRYAQIHRAREHLGDVAGMARVGERWLSFLRSEQARSDGAERATLTASLQFALETLGDRPAALDVLVDAVRAAPDNAEALLRYATALDDADKVDDAIGVLARGATTIPPPRRLPVLWQEATLLRKKNDVAGELAVLDASAALFAVTPAAPHYDSVRKKVEARRAELARR